MTLYQDNLPDGHSWVLLEDQGSAVCKKCKQAMMLVLYVSSKDVDECRTLDDNTGPLYNVWLRFGWMGHFDFDALIPDDCETTVNINNMDEALS